MQLRFDIIQNTEEWLALKVGKFSASTADSLLMDKKTAGYKKLINRIVEERMTGIETESNKFQGNVFTERGHEFEPIAREDYELRTFNTVETIGVIELNEWVLCSPDGLIGNDGMYQAKCPIFNTQREYLKKYYELHKNKLSCNQILYKLSSVYYKQMQFELFVSGRNYNIFNSYHPFLAPIDLKILRDEIMMAEISVRIKEAKEEILNEIQFLNSINNI